MNAIARAAFNENSFVIKGISFSFELPEFKVMILILLLLASALGVVYVKDLNRRLFITYHEMQKETEKLQALGNKLLLEQSAWGAQARVQIVAQKQLQMQIPSSANVVMIKI